MNNIEIGCDRVHNHMCAWCFEICSFIYEKYYSKYNVLVQSASAFWWLRKWRLFIYLYVEVEWTTNNFATQYLLGHPSKLGSYICTNWTIWCTEIIVKATCSQGKPLKNPTLHFTSEYIYVDIMSLIFFTMHFYLFYLFIHTLNDSSLLLIVV